MAMQERIEKLERQVRWLGSCALILTTIVTALLGLAAKLEPDSAKVLRARGVIIEDEQGRERILIGASAPGATKNAATMSGLLVLDPNGTARIALGNPVPDPIQGKRNAPLIGLAMYDSDGLERTGYGVHNTGGGDQPTLGLDYRDREGLSFSVQDGGPGKRAAGLIQSGTRHLYLGSGDGALIDMPGGDKPFSGLAVGEGSRVDYVLNAAK
jgi:hypothetical protein